MVWHKSTEGEYGDYLLAWITDAQICPNMPDATIVVGVFDLDEDDLESQVHWLQTYLLPNNDEDSSADLYGIVELNTDLQYDKDPDWLGREARRCMSAWLKAKPDWFVNWYRDKIMEEREFQEALRLRMSQVNVVWAMTTESDGFAEFPDDIKKLVRAAEGLGFCNFWYNFDVLLADAPNSTVEDDRVSVTWEALEWKKQ